MIITKIESDQSIYIVTGSNGLIGSHVVSCMLQSARGSKTDVKHIPLKREDSTAEAITRLADQGSCGPARLVLCHGGKGFSLNNKRHQSEMKEFSLMCRQIAKKSKIQSCTLASSCGCILSKINTPYKVLTAEKELLLKDLFMERASIIRLPSVFGRKPNGDYSGLVGALLINTLRQQRTTIYGRLSTRRNYLSAELCGQLITDIVHRRSDYHGLDRVTELYSTQNLSISEVVRAVKKALRRQPIVSMRSGSDYDCESHLPIESPNNDRLLVSENIERWIRQQRLELRLFQL